MRIAYKNKNIEYAIITSNFLVSSCVIATFILLFGFDQPIFKSAALYNIQVVALLLFVAEKLLRFFNSQSKKEFIKAYWFEIPLLVLLFAGTLFSNKLGLFEGHGKTVMLGIYLIVQVLDKLCRTCVNLAATGQNPMRTLIVTFIILIIGGAGFLSLPRSHDCQELSFIDAVFTATSAACVTGLIVKDTGEDFSRMGQIVILTLIQLGGLGIVIFGAVFALLLGQAFSVRESVAMQDLLSANTLNRIGNMIGFIFIATIVIEAIGAIATLGMWHDAQGGDMTGGHQLYYSIFHSISAFCNAGFSLFKGSLTDYSNRWQTFAVFCPLIIVGGLGFGVLYNIANVVVSRVRFLAYKIKYRNQSLCPFFPRRFTLQTKIVVLTSIILITVGAIGFLILENNQPCAAGQHGNNYSSAEKIGNAFFQSVTTRTAGFNTIDNGALSEASKLWTIIFMLIGGSPGSTAGGMKTVTLVVVIMAAYATMIKRSEVEMFNRSIRYSIVGRALTVVMFFIAVYFFITFALCITERASNFKIIDIMFEAASALGTVGLSTGITSSLTTGGKFIIIAAMLIGRLGPLTLLASLTFNLRPAKYSYPDEAIMVG